MQNINWENAAMTSEIDKLKEEINKLKSAINNSEDEPLEEKEFEHPNVIPTSGAEAKEVETFINDEIILDVAPELNTSSYVNINLDVEEKALAVKGLQVNIADQTVYPQSFKMHDKLVNMIANLWNCPKPDDFDDYGCYPGACTVGSTEACLLAGLALKFRWRNWYAKKNNLSMNEVLGERPNIIISTCFQAAWEKLIKYMDIDAKFIQPTAKDFKIDPKQALKLIDDHTIGVIAIMGNHYGGQYDPVWELNKIVEEVNKNNNLQVGIHVDAASGGFIAPFQKGLPDWDFRLKNVLSISASGHKFGESCIGTGWVVWRQRKDLSEHVAISVSYLGGQAESYTLNFSRPASGIYVQYYKFLRFGMAGYQKSCDHMMRHAHMIRSGLKKMQYKGKPRFTILDDGDKHCLPVVTAMLNPDCNFDYDDIDLQHAISQQHWYVSGYRMGFEDPITKQIEPLFYDQNKKKTMFRVVVKANINNIMVENLLQSIEESVNMLDSIQFKANSLPSFKETHAEKNLYSKHC